MNHQSLRDDLAFLETFKEKTRIAALANGHYFVVWGLAVCTGLAYSDLQFRWHMPVHALVVWAVVIFLGWFYTARTLRRERRTARATPHTGRFLDLLWIFVGISMTVAFMTGGMFGALAPGSVAGLTAAFLAIPLMMNGWLTGLRWLVGVGILWWVSVPVLFAIPRSWSVLALAGCMLALFVAPGWVLHAQARSIADRCS